MVQGTCSKCGTRAEVSGCTECVNNIAINDNLQPSVSCSKSCQEDHWNHHKTACLARRQLRRASDLLVTIWMASRDEAYVLPMSEVQEIGGKLQVYLGAYEHNQVLVRFPSDLVSDTLDKQALLSHDFCTDALAHTFDLSKKVFEGIYDKIEEATVMMKAAAKVVLHHPSQIDNSETSHVLLLLKLKDGFQYAIDLAGAQYGQHRIIMPWTQYRSLISEQESIDVHSTQIERVKKTYANVADTRLPAVQIEVWDHLHETVKKWEQEAGKSLAVMLRGSSEQEYETHKGVLLAKVRKDMREYIQQAESDGRWDYTIRRV